MNFKFFIFSIFNAFRRKTILFIAIVGTGLGTSLMATLMSLSAGMDRQLEKTMDLVGNSITVAAADAPLVGGFGGGSPLPISYLDTIKELDYTKQAIPQIISTIPKEVLDLGSPAGSFISGMDLAIDKETKGPTTKIIEGRTIENDNEVIMGKALQRMIKLNDAELDVGDIIKIPVIKSLPSQKDIDINNIDVESFFSSLPESIELKVVGIYETGNNLADNRFVTDINTVRELSGLDEEQISFIEVRADSTENVETLAEEIEKSFEGSVTPIQVSIPKDLLGDLNSTLDIFDKFIWVIGLVSAIAGGMSIFIITLMSVMERLKEFGVFKATGWSNFNIIASVIIESIAVAILGSAFGLAIGLTAGEILNNYFSEEISFFTIGLIVWIISFGIGMGVLGGIIPAIKAARVSPIETLQSN